MNSEQQVSNPITHQAVSPYEDEISLVDIIRVLLRRKILILEIVIVSVCLGLAYAFTQPRVYQVETILSPPSIENIQSFNLRNLQNINGDTLFASFTTLVETRRFRQDFFDKFNLIETFSNKPVEELTARELNKAFEGFSDNLKKDKKDKKDKNKSITFTLKGGQKEDLGPWLDSFVSMANEKTINQFVNNVESERNFNIKKLKKDIKDKRFFYSQKRKDELARLNENYQTAKILGIVERSSAWNAVLPKNSLTIHMQATKRYMEGTKILKAEINAIKNRKSDDIHISGLRAAQEQLAKLESLTINKGDLQAVTIDKKAAVSLDVIGPKRKLIAMLSLILGGMLGIFAVFMMVFVDNFKKTNG